MFFICLARVSPWWRVRGTTSLSSGTHPRGFAAQRRDDTSVGHMHIIDHKTMAVDDGCAPGAAHCTHP
jgi:hypothetical protein